MIDGSEKRNRQLAFEFRIRMFVKSAVIAFVIQTFESRATELRGFHSHTNN